MTVNYYDAIIVGGGIFGCQTAISLAKRGRRVAILERESDLLLGASLNNQNRVHKGYHYPRNISTAQQSLEGFRKFCDEYSGAVSDCFDQFYCVASNFSKCSADEFLNFCQKLGAQYREVDSLGSGIQIKNVDVIISVREAVYDAQILREAIRRRLRFLGVDIFFNRSVNNISKRENHYFLTTDSTDIFASQKLVNATYANIQAVNGFAGLVPRPLIYEYTMVPIIEFTLPKRVGVTVMDGQFMTLLPYGHSRDYLLYHVKKSRLEVVEADDLPSRWSDSEWLNHRADCSAIINESSYFMPDLVAASIKGFLHGPRLLLPESAVDDGRPSLFTDHGAGFYSVFSGKVDHCIDVAESLANAICNQKVPA